MTKPREDGPSGAGASQKTPSTGGQSKNSAPDAVKDPSEKTGGKPGLPSGKDRGEDADPGAG